nr:MAG TPA: ATP synthase B/B' [Bacteriophage sp.]
MFIGFCLFMAWFVKDPVGHIMNGLTFLETLCQ